ncbi:uncharacterized protein LOC132382572 [Hypanus sabinus]|uniref:uncharacterized protein LOC132382572 n=1 Tax=Hypanus sabinus TaxID=79690 RepID=UPI0028C3D5E9|nr:uncharacterized protein LOC132382572 [Hypanus sabinus]
MLEHAELSSLASCVDYEINVKEALEVLQTNCQRQIELFQMGRFRLPIGQCLGWSKWKYTALCLKIAKILVLQGHSRYPDSPDDTQVSCCDTNPRFACLQSPEILGFRVHSSNKKLGITVAYGSFEDHDLELHADYGSLWEWDPLSAFHNRLLFGTPKPWPKISAWIQKPGISSNWRRANQGSLSPQETCVSLRGSWNICCVPGDPGSSGTELKKSEAPESLGIPSKIKDPHERC